MTKDPFGFDVAASNEALDLNAFAPKPRATNRAEIEAVREVARDNGFTRRTKSEKPASLETPSPAEGGGKRRKSRVNITTLLGIEDRYPETERAQLNMLAPVPVVLRWRKLVQDQQQPAWEVLERAMDAFEKAERK